MHFACQMSNSRNSMSDQGTHGLCPIPHLYCHSLLCSPVQITAMETSLLLMGEVSLGFSCPSFHQTPAHSLPSPAKPQAEIYPLEGKQDLVQRQIHMMQESGGGFGWDFCACRSWDRDRDRDME